MWPVTKIARVPLIQSSLRNLEPPAERRITFAGKPGTLAGTCSVIRLRWEGAIGEMPFHTDKMAQRFEVAVFDACMKETAQASGSSRFAQERQLNRMVPPQNKKTREFTMNKAVTANAKELDENPEKIVFKILMRAADTNGGVGLIEEVTPPNQGPPLHIHDKAGEFFRVIEGRYRFKVGDDVIDAGPGDTAYVPAGTPHCFANAGTTPGRLFIGFAPGGAEALFDYVEELADADLTDPAIKVRFKDEFDLTMLGPNPLIVEE